MVEIEECHVLERPNKSPYLNPTEMLGKDLKRAVHPRKPTSTFSTDKRLVGLGFSRHSFLGNFA